MTTAMTRRLEKLEQAVTYERKREPYQIQLVAHDDDSPPGEPWVPGMRITRIRLVSL